MGFGIHINFKKAFKKVGGAISHAANQAAHAVGSATSQVAKTTAHVATQAAKGTVNLAGQVEHTEGQLAHKLNTAARAVGMGTFVAQFDLATLVTNPKKYASNIAKSASGDLRKDLVVANAVKSGNFKVVASELGDSAASIAGTLGANAATQAQIRQAAKSGAIGKLADSVGAYFTGNTKGLQSDLGMSPAAPQTPNQKAIDKTPLRHQPKALRKHRSKKRQSEQLAVQQTRTVDLSSTVMAQSQATTPERGELPPRYDFSIFKTDPRTMGGLYS